MARVTAVGDGYDDGVVVRHPVIQFGDGAPPAVVGYPPPPPPAATLQRGRPEQRCSSRCGPCEIFTTTFMVVVAVESLTYFLLAMILHKFPSPITAMLLSPVTLLAFFGSFACCLAVSGCCDDRLVDGQN
uniref:Uncharacterized protein n=1 Tax=Oryza meridionalis TaxID=40149 RepID=A0A0E0CBI3_9ORYZ